jgi:hypothetical protein
VSFKTSVRDAVWDGKAGKWNLTGEKIRFSPTS